MYGNGLGEQFRQLMAVGIPGFVRRSLPPRLDSRIMTEKFRQLSISARLEAETLS
jgi:hypothetical protein